MISQNKGSIPFGFEPPASDFVMPFTARLQCFHCAYAVFSSRVSEAISLYVSSGSLPTRKNPSVFPAIHWGCSHTGEAGTDLPVL
jgi:hypothetical protein